MNPAAKKRKRPDRNEKQTLELHLDLAPVREFADSEVTAEFRPMAKAFRNNQGDMIRTDVICCET